MAQDPLQKYDGLDIGAWAKYQPQSVASGLVDAANLGDEVALRWVRRLHQHGVTESLLADVDQIVRDVPWGAFLILEPSSGKFEWRLRPVRDSLADRESIFAWMVAWLISVDGVGGLKRCALPKKMEGLAKRFPSLRKKVRRGTYDCKNYLVGNSKAKWCSNRCGTLYRITEKREKKKRDQMLGSQML